MSNAPGSSAPSGASANSPKGASKATNAELEAQISKLREDVAGVAEALQNLANERVEGARRQAYALRDDARDRGERFLRQAQDTASDLEAQASEYIREKPLKSVLMAAAFGYLYARLFKR